VKAHVSFFKLKKFKILNLKRSRTKEGTCQKENLS
jgi:hypothetical protein